MRKLRPRASKPLSRAEEKAETSLARGRDPLCAPRSCLRLSALGPHCPWDGPTGDLSPADTPLSEQTCQQAPEGEGLGVVLSPSRVSALFVGDGRTGLTSHKRQFPSALPSHRAWHQVPSQRPCPRRPAQALSLSRRLPSPPAVTSLN